MTFSEDIRWRAIVLYSLHGMLEEDVAALLGVSVSTLMRWVGLFNRTGNVRAQIGRNRSPRWPEETYQFTRQYAIDHPCFILEELQEAIQSAFPSLVNVSTPTICRALKFELGLSRKVLQKRAREALPVELREYHSRLAPWYQDPKQLLFMDETSKDGRSSLRKYAWSSVGVPAIVELPFSRGQRVSALAAFNHSGFIAWDFTTGTFTRQGFHQVFIQKILPYLNPWPLHNSILILDNARIHMYSELIEAVESRGAIVIFLPPYSPQLNPIEVGFALVKQWIQKNTNLAFHFAPAACLDIAFHNCASTKDISINLFHHCGYAKEGLREEMFRRD